ncbi:hypothetical protein MPTK1_6g12510 [Marchantia polymorpha subsp. ruderalis]|uniref:Uncharacterized protein n=2 Tax=Marchantia polymorpha TaxID=3197 RepID=A0AAF6BRB5_MARPO|nr:hypothetical protein MARPO_0059s0096 [Marchantia polymorpha]BBN14549.1 hypothetical protein Mp_6g12510 [Marchantia polymorpha subsp. ruderalis]|eukprot:PTQ37171.1 hypothetical protein MARPO_0059s0096 [Marchantia polymorpha]
MAMAAAGARIPSCWEAVGRGTEVGRALFALYNGYGVARNRGNEFSDRNRLKILQRLANLSLEDICEAENRELPPPKPKKPIVKVPHFRKGPMTVDDIPQVLLMRGRRKSSQILNKLKEDIAKRELPPMPTKPLLDEKEKQRLQYVFEWSGRDCGSDDEDEPVVPANPPPPRGSVEEQEMLMEEIGHEIEERRVFLDRMYELGRGPKYEPIIHAEIQERIRQMELLDKTITLMDKERLERRRPKCSARSSVVSRATSKQSTRSHCDESERGQMTDLDNDEVRSTVSSHRSWANEEGEDLGSERSFSRSQKSDQPHTASGKGSESGKSLKLSRTGSRPSRPSTFQTASARSNLESSIPRSQA